MGGSGNDFASRRCVPCRGGVPPLQGEELAKLSAELPDWSGVERHHIEKNFLFPNFTSALAFVARIGEIAEEQGHHPDICFGWGYARVTNFTHKISGLTERDLLIEAEVDRL